LIFESRDLLAARTHLSRFLWSHSVIPVDPRPRVSIVVPSYRSRATIERFLESSGADFAGLDGAAISSAIEDAIDRVGHAEFGIETEDANGVFAVVEPLPHVAAAGATALLLPYCAKPVDCELRHTDECTVCGRCAIGDAYTLAAELGLEVTTITNFEHLMETLADMKRRGVAAFVGSCCEAFYLKHRAEMEEHGVPGVLVDVGSDTCYDLGRAREAYGGTFEGETTLRLGLLETVVRACARAGVGSADGGADRGERTQGV